MKIVAVSDHFVRTEHYEACFAKYPEYELKTVFFGYEDRYIMRDIFHKIERNGPEAYPIPEELFELVEEKHFWLSETPQIPSKGWNANYYRVCSYAALKHKATGFLPWPFCFGWYGHFLLAVLK